MAQYRIRTEYDNSAENPMTWGDHVTEDGPAMEAWRAGEVYGVILEELHTWQRVSEDGSQTFCRDEWEEVESIWECYLSADYSPRTAAAEHFPQLFGMSADELAQIETTGAY